ncbi:MAG: hypothetical protein ACR2LQ_12695 [Acidimicrobiales bacterium]
MNRRTPLAVALAIAGAVALAACGGSSNAARSSPSSASSGATTGCKAPNPNTPESNPSGDIPDNQCYVAYSDAAGSFTVDVPEGWSRTNAGGVVTFTDKLNSIRLDVVAAAAAPTADTAAALEVPAIEAAAKSYEAGKVSTGTRTAGQAVLITYKADSAPDAVTGKVIHLDVERYEFWRGGKEAILTLSGPVGADNVDPWKTVTDSFGWQ